ncbi:hypothetical protein [Flavobacterium sp.]|uniref:hypothetical protein n=1 Tax=Flavobacterium sp. TaxID=239 RepID=UPI003A93AFB4
MKKHLFKTVLIAVTLFLTASCSNDDANEIIEDQPTADNILILRTNNEALQSVNYVDINGDLHISPTTNNGTLYENKITSMQLVSSVRIKTDEAVTVQMHLNSTHVSQSLDEHSCYILTFTLNNGVSIPSEFVKVDCSN